MAKLKLRTTILSKLSTLTRNEGNLVITRDGESLYFDTDDKRFRITDFIDIADDNDRLAILAPNTEKMYYVLSTNAVWRYISGSWHEVTSTEDISDILIAISGKADSNKAYLTDDSVESVMADDDYVPFYDTSASAKKKSTFSNLVAKIKAKIGRSSPSSGGTDLTLVNTGDMYTWNSKAETSDITSAINDLDVTGASNISAGKTIKAWSETDGKVSITTQNISITKSQVSDFPTLGTASTKNSTTSVTQNSDDLVTSGAVWTAIDELPEPMVFKGSLGTDGTIADLPMNGSATIGDTYKVITEADYGNGTYHGKVGDTFICYSQNTTAHTNTWTLIPSGDEPSGTVTSVTIKATSPIVVNSSSAITTSGTRTISHAASGVVADSYGDSGNQTPNYGGTFKVPYITVNDTGHITEINSHTVKIPASDNTDRYVNSASFTDDTTDNSSNPVKMTLTRAGSDTTKVIANIPKVSSTTAGVVPKGAAVSSQSQSTKFLRSDGTWQTPSYTTNTDTKVTQTLVSTNKNYPLLFSTRETSDTQEDRTGTAQRNNSIYVNPSNKMITVDSAIYSKWIDALVKPTLWVKKPSSGTGANAGLALDTKGGRWGMFTYPSSNETLYFQYFTDAKIADPSQSTSNTADASFSINGSNNVMSVNIIDTKLQATDITVASNDQLVVTDSSDSNKLRRTSIKFGTSETTFLNNKGEWATPVGTTYTAATAAPGKVASASAKGTSTNYARQDHTHGIDLATGDANGQVKIAGTNVDVKGLGSNAYTSTSYLPLAGGRLTGNLYNKSALGNVDATANDNGISDTVYSGTIEGQDKNNRRITRLETSAYANGDICFGMNIRQWYMNGSTATVKATKGFKLTMNKAGALSALLDGNSNADWFVGKNGFVVGNPTSNYAQLTLDSGVSGEVFLTTPSSNGKLSITSDLGDYNKQVGTCNLMRYPSQHTSKSQNGLIFLDNGDGSVTVTGTATANTTYYFAVRGNNIWQVILSAGTYMLIGCPSGGSSSTYSIYCNTYIDGTTTASSGVRDTGSGATVTYDYDVSMGCYIDIKKNTAFPTNGVVFRPQIIPFGVYNIDNYIIGAPYAQTNRQLTITKADYSQIATYENTQNASRAYAKNELMIWRGALYRVTTAISSGSTISTSNVTATTLSDEIKAIRNALNI